MGEEVDVGATGLGADVDGSVSGPLEQAATKTKLATSTT